MFETSRRRPHPLHSFRFWFVVLAAGSVTLAWKFDMLPVRIGPAATGELAEETFTEVDRSTDATAAGETADVDLPFSDDDESLHVHPLSESSAPLRTALVEPRLAPPPQAEPIETSLAQAEPSLTAQQNSEPAPFAESKPAAPPQLFGDDEWPTARASSQPTIDFSQASPTQTPPAEMPPVARVTASPIVQATATSTAFETEDPAAATSSSAPFDTDDTSSVPPSVAAGIDLTEVDRLLATGITTDEIEAHRMLSSIYWQQPAARPLLRERIDTLAQKIYFQESKHYMDAYQVQPGDMLQAIARQYDISWQYLAKLNRVDPKRVRAGQRLKVIKGPFSAIVDLSDFELSIHAHGYFVTRYPVGVGKDGSSPIGKFTVKDKLIDPTYYGPDGVVDHDDPTNPLGERWIDIGDSYGIHGTIDPTSIGKSESRGCIRLHNDDINAVYDLLTIGSEVTIRP